MNIFLLNIIIIIIKTYLYKITPYVKTTAINGGPGISPRPIAPPNDDP